MRRVNGSISVFLALTITMLLSFCMVLIESARENTLLLKADIVFDTGVKSLLAEYHTVLWEEYDLFYVDCSYGTQLPDYGLVKNHLQKYVDKNFEYDFGSWLSLDYEGAQITDVLLATDFQGEDFYLQAVEAAEASVGIPYIEQALKWLEQVEANAAVGESMREDKQEASSAIEEANGTEVEVKEAVWGTGKAGQPILLEEAEYEVVDIDNPLDRLLSANILLQQVVEDSSNISSVSVDVNSLASHRNLSAGTVTDSMDADGLWNKVLFCKYVIDHFECYTDDMDEEQTGLRCELEYLIGGRASDAQNLEIVVAELLAIREIDNYLTILQDEERQLSAHSIAAVAASLVPWLEPVVYHAVLLYWAYEDSVADLQRLFRGENIPLVKSLPVDAITDFTLGYEEYLMLLLLLQSRENLAMRSIDMIELFVREKQSSFRMDACISSAVFTGTFWDIYDKKYTITKKLQYY